MRVLLLLLVWLQGCATAADLGVLQRAPGVGTGASVHAHVGAGLVPERILVASVDLRGDVAESGDRFALGGSVLGGLPVGPYKVLARAGLWHAVASSTDERAVVPSFELAGFIPLFRRPPPENLKYGDGASGLVVGVREDLDARAYTTVFVGFAVFLSPGY